MQAAYENQIAKISITSDEQPFSAVRLPQDILVGGPAESNLNGTNHVMPKR